MIRETLRDRAEEEERPTTLRLRGGVPRAGLGGSRLRLRRGEGPVQVDRRSLRLLPRARQSGAVKGEGPAEGAMRTLRPTG